MSWSWLWHSPAASSSLHERLSSLPWALPYLIFMIIGIILGVRSSPEQAVPMFAWLTVFILVYVSTWIRSDSAPVHAVGVRVADRLSPARSAFGDSASGQHQ